MKGTTKTGLGFYVLAVSVSILFGCNKHEKEKVFLLELTSPDDTGIYFSNDITEGYNHGDNVLSYTNFYNGGGVAVGDINNDGLVDIYLSSNQKTGKLFLNKGDFNFIDITKGAGMDSIPGWKTGVQMVDINQDGYLDIYMCRSGRVSPNLRTNLLFVNNGNMTFTEQSKEFGLDISNFSLHSAFFDFDLDGDLDMYMLNHSLEPVKKLSKHLKSYDDNNDIGDKLYRNDGGKYVELAQSIGLNQSMLGDGLGLAVSDFNNNGLQDVYVCNDFLGPDFLYYNTGQGNFKESALSAMKHISYSSMGADAADINNDGLQDLFVAEMRSSTNYGRKTNMSNMDPKAFEILTKVGGHFQYMRNTLQLNNGNGTFSDIAPLAGVASTDWSWAPLFVDLDNDGLKDLFITNGIRKNTNNKDFDKFQKERIEKAMRDRETNVASVMKELLKKVPSEKSINTIYKNSDGLGFEQTNASWGVNEPSYSNGAAYADLDNDGDMDLIINNIDQQAHIYRNNSLELNTNNYLRIKLMGSPSNRNGIGAKLMIQTKEGNQFLEQQVSRGYQSSVDFILHFGLGSVGMVDKLSVKWPDGKVSEIAHIAANQLIYVDYSKATVFSQTKEKGKPVFTDVTSDYKLAHEHLENGYYDFEREVLLPHRMSTFGPALAVGDINMDGLEDFFIGGAKGYEAAIYIQNSNNAFTKTNQLDIVASKAHEDVDAEFFDSDNDGDLDLYVVSGGNEMPVGDAYYQDRLYINDGKGRFSLSTNSLPKITASGGVVRANDYDADGDLDLFVGGRLLPGEYPKTSRSYLLENNGGRFQDVIDEHDDGLEFPGMVTDALWSDFNGDGVKDLILVGEWMPITFFENVGGNLRKIKEDLTLAQSSGWWWCITEADVNNDGRMDYLLGNLGENYKYTVNDGSPFLLYSKDFDENGSLDIVLSFYEDDKLYPLRGKQCSSEQIPSLGKKFKNYSSFGLATLEEVYGSESLNKADRFEVKTFSNSMLINSKKGYELVKLPKAAQISAVFGMVYDDFDKDGAKDIVIAGNLYNSEVETPRNDAGRGLFLKGNNEALFSPIENCHSGLYIDGDVKKMKPIRLGIQENSRKGLIVGINNDFIKLIATND